MHVVLVCHIRSTCGQSTYSGRDSTKSAYCLLCLFATRCRQDVLQQYSVQVLQLCGYLFVKGFNGRRAAVNGSARPVRDAAITGFDLGSSMKDLLLGGKTWRSSQAARMMHRIKSELGASKS